MSGYVAGDNFEKEIAELTKVTKMEGISSIACAMIVLEEWDLLKRC